MSVLDRVRIPADIRGLTTDELAELCGDIRRTIIDTVAERGGHLASSLGAVELTVALHAVFDTPRDKIVWDVGHQAYAHKILTGRKDRFHTLRSLGGISGFPNRDESDYDVMTVGHSSTSISAALGVACARDLAGERYKSIAVIGDGSLTAGLALEGVNNAGHLGKNLLVVLNDNEMSISENVGALSSYLSRILTGEAYTRLRRKVEGVISGLPGGKTFLVMAKKFEEVAKSIITPGVIFEELGFHYVGPVNGNDLPMLIETLRNVARLDGPVLLHIFTKKGLGFEPAMQNAETFHGVPPFCKETGTVAKSSGGSYTDIFGETLCSIADADSRVVAITAAMTLGTGLKRFAGTHRERFFDVGIAEQHAVTFAAGMATQGFRPFVAIYSTFLQRSIDMIVHDVCLPRLPVVFCVDRAGLVGEDGPTHHGQFDLTFLRMIPNLVVAAPADGTEFQNMLRSTAAWDGPVAIRYPRGTAFICDDGCCDEKIPPGKGELRRNGGAAAVLAIGPVLHEVLAAAQMLAGGGVELTVVNARFAKPLDEALVIAVLRSHPVVFTYEENSVAGGFGSAVLELAAREGIGTPVHVNGLPDAFVEHGASGILRERCGLTAAAIAARIEAALRP